MTTAGCPARRNPPVNGAEISECARVRANTKCTPDGLPVHSLATLLADRTTLTLNEAMVPSAPGHGFPVRARLAALQAWTFDLPELHSARLLP